MVTRDEILSEIRRLAAENEGVAVGRTRFATQTGIRESDWLGRYWVRWSDAVAEAGLQPNVLNEARHSEEELTRQVADLTLELGHFPTIAERRMKRRSDRGFPSSGTIETRLGGRQSLIRRLVEFAAERPGYEAVTVSCGPLLEPEEPAQGARDAAQPGYVYLIRMDRWHKIGCSRNILRRRGEIRLILPAREQLVHTIETDDPYGVEQYWHRRFADRRTQGEWFDLAPGDVVAFRRWRKIF